MSRLASFSLLVAAGSLGAQTLLPEDAKVMLPDYLMAEIEGEGMLGRPWICVLPPPIDFEPYIIDKENEGGTDEPVIAGPCEPYLEPEFLSCVIDESSDGDVILGFNYATGMTALTRRSTGETEVMPMIPASALVAPDAIAPAVMVELNATRLSADGNVVIGSVSWGSGGPFRHRAWGLGGVELLEVPSDSWESAVAEELSSDGAIVVGSAFQVDSGNQQAVRWDLAGKLTALNPIQDGAMGSSARLVTPDGSVIAGDVFSYEGGGIVPFRWSEGDGFRQLGDPLANDDQVIVESLSEDGQVLSGQRYESDGDVATWYWTAEEGFRDVEIAICDFEGEDAEGYKLTGIDPVRRVFVGTFADGSEFLSFNGVSISPIAWMGSITGPVGTLRSAFALSGQAMEGAHHRPIGQLAVPGKATFAWFTGDLGKAWKERDTEQVSGEVGYGLRLGAEGVLGFAFGYSDLDRDYGATGAGESKGAFAVADLGLVLGKSDLTLTAFFGKTDVTTPPQRVAGLDGGRGPEPPRALRWRGLGHSRPDADPPLRLGDLRPRQDGRLCGGRRNRPRGLRRTQPRWLGRSPGPLGQGRAYRLDGPRRDGGGREGPRRESPGLHRHRRRHGSPRFRRAGRAGEDDLGAPRPRPRP